MTPGYGVILRDILVPLNLDTKGMSEFCCKCLLIWFNVSEEIHVTTIIKKHKQGVLLCN